MKIHIAAPDIHVGDAVGNHCLALALDFAEQGHTCELFAQRATSPHQTVRPLADLLSGAAPHTSQDLLLLSHSIYDPHLRQLLKLPGRKLAYFHGITPPELLLEHDPVAAYYCARGYAQLPLLAQFDRVVANSAFNLRDLQQHIPGGLAPERTSVVPPISARFPLFARPARAPRPIPAQPGQPLHLLTVGRVVPHKRIEDLIEVVALLAQQGQAAHLHVVGSSHNADYRARLDRTIQTHGVQAHVHLHGMVSDAELAQQYEAADVLLVASLHEGFCVPVLEAMHLGLPVVLRSGTAAAEVLGYESYEFATTHECCVRINQIMGQDQLQGLGRHLHEQSQALVKFAQAKRFVDLLKNP
jgi:glycosyltransferase involved in cell wall biosynthesis